MNEIGILAATVALSVAPSPISHASEHSTGSISGYDRFRHASQTGEPLSWFVRPRAIANSGLMALLAAWDVEDASIVDDDFDESYSEFIANNPRLA